MSNPFDYVTSINTTKKNMMRDTENDTLAEKDYNAFLVNKALSYFPDTILHANMMNQYHHLPNRPQYEFLQNSIRTKKRWSKWAKPVEDERLQHIMEYYQYNSQRAQEVMELLTDEQIAEICKLCDKGGRA